MAGSVLLIAEQAKREPQRGDVAGRPELEGHGRSVAAEQGDFAAPSHRDDDHAAEDRQGGGKQNEGHKQNRAMASSLLTRLPGNGHRIPALVAVAATLDAASGAVSAGADIIDLGAAGPSGIAAFQAMHPGVAFCAADARAVLTRQHSLARVGEALLICPDLTAARSCGLPADRLAVEVPPAGIAAAIRAGYAPLVDADQESVPASVAVAALSGWLGAALIRTRYPVQVRRALDMTATIQGLRPPARTVRGLA